MWEIAALIYDTVVVRERYAKAAAAVYRSLTVAAPCLAYPRGGSRLVVISL